MTAAAVVWSATPAAGVRSMLSIKSAAMIAVATPSVTGSRSRLAVVARCAIRVRSTRRRIMVTVIRMADLAVTIQCVAVDFTSHLVVDDAYVSTRTVIHHCHRSSNHNNNQAVFRKLKAALVFHGLENQATSVCVC